MICICQCRTTLYSLVTDKRLAIYVIITNLYLRHEITCLCEEIRQIAVYREGQHGCLFYVICPSHEFRVTSTYAAVVATYLVVNRRQVCAVFLHGDVIAILASAEGEFHRSIHVYRDRTALNTVLGVLVVQVRKTNIARLYAAFR